MRFHRAIFGAAILAAVLTSGGAQAFETTSIGGTNPDGSAKFQDPDDQQTSALLGGSVQVQQGYSQQGGASPFFGWGGSQLSSSSQEPSTPFNNPILRQRN